MKKNNKKGFGIVATIIVIAVIGLVVYAIYSSSKNKTNVEVDEFIVTDTLQETHEGMMDSIIDIETDVVDTLSLVKTKLALKTEVGAKEAVKALDDLEKRIEAQSTNLYTETKTQVGTFQRRVTNLKKRITENTVSISESIETELDTLISEIDEFFDEIESVLVDEVEAVVEAELEESVDAIEESEMEQDQEISDEGMNKEGAIEGENVSGEITTETDVEIIVDDVVEVEADGTADALIVVE